MPSPSPAFLHLPKEHHSACVALVGAPFAQKHPNSSSGCDEAPAAIRRRSPSLSSYSPLLDLDLHEVGAVDRGDLAFPDRSPSQAQKAIREAVSSCLADEITPVLLGGEPICTLSAVEATLSSYPDLVVVRLGAHASFQPTPDSTWGRQAVMANLLKQVGDPQRLLAYGLRAGQREEFARARRCRLCGPFPSQSHQRLAAFRFHLDDFHLRPLYLSISLDVFDPSLAAGTPQPVPGGILMEELHQLLHDLKGRTIVGADLVGCSPSQDPTQVSTVLAATVARDLCLLATTRSHHRPAES